MPKHLTTRAIGSTLAIFCLLLTSCTKAPQGVTVRCEEDEYVEDGECVACPAGSTNTSDAYAGGDTKCEPTRCSVNQRVEEHRCVDCEPGTTRTAGDEATGANTFCEVSVCGADEHVQGGECVACPAGTTNEPGDRRTDGDSPCEPVLCQMNEHVESNVCVACEPGTANDAGDDSSAGDTACDVTTCELDHFVESNTCVPCPDDTINDAGDAANGPDSSCRDAICRRNERVSLRQCVPCAQDMINLPGDHAALGDTSCTPSVTKIMTAINRTCTLHSDGRLLCWGDNHYGNINDTEHLVATNRPQAVSLPEPVLDFGMGQNHTCALLQNGEVYCWGSNQFGQLKPIEEQDSEFLTHHPPTPIRDLPPDGIQLYVGSFHACLLTDDNEVYCWGQNSAGQLGAGFTSTSETPLQVRGLPDNISRLIQGGGTTCALTADNQLWCWGNNQSQMIKPDPQGAPILTPEQIAYPGYRHDTLAVGSSTACILSDSGEVHCRGNDLFRSFPTPEPDRFHRIDGLPTGITDIQVTAASACVLGPSAGIYCWGTTLDSTPYVFDIERVPNINPEEVTQLSANLTHSCARMKHGGVRCWGDNRAGALGDNVPIENKRPSQAELPSPATHIHTGSSATCANTTSGELFCWGQNASGQLGNGSTTDSSNPTRVVVSSDEHQTFTMGQIGFGHSCAVTPTSELYCWGSNQSGQLGDLTSVQRTRPVLTSEIRSGTQQVVVGSWHTCALSSDQEVFCWGSNKAGQLATSTSSSALPLPVTNLGGWPTKLASGSNHICALTVAGDVVCWGSNRYGQIDASNSSEALHTPQVRPGLGPNIVDISASGSNHTCVVLADGDIQCWGDNRYGQLGDGSTDATSDIITIESDGAPYVQVSPGAQHTCAVRSDGSVWCWGSNQFGHFHPSERAEFLTPTKLTTLDNITQVSASSYHTCALQADGRVFCWGLDAYGQLGRKRLLYSEDPIDVTF